MYRPSGRRKFNSEMPKCQMSYYIETSTFWSVSKMTQLVFYSDGVAENIKFSSSHQEAITFFFIYIYLEYVPIFEHMMLKCMYLFISIKWCTMLIR